MPTTVVTTSDGSCCCPAGCVPCVRAQTLTCVRVTVTGCACLSGVFQLPYFNTIATGGFPSHTVRHWRRASGWDIDAPCGTGAGNGMLWDVYYNHNTGCWFQAYSGICGAGNANNLTVQTAGIVGNMVSCSPLDVRWTWGAENITCLACSAPVNVKVSDCSQTACCPEADLPTYLYATMGGVLAAMGTVTLTRINTTTWQGTSAACGGGTVLLQLQCVVAGGAGSGYVFNLAGAAGGSIASFEVFCNPVQFTGTGTLSSGTGTCPAGTYTVTVTETPP